MYQQVRSATFCQLPSQQKRQRRRERVLLYRGRVLVTVYLLRCTCYGVLVTVYLLPCTCYCVLVTVYLLPWTCYRGLVTVDLLPWTLCLQRRHSIALLNTFLRKSMYLSYNLPVAQSTQTSTTKSVFL